MAGHDLGGRRARLVAETDTDPARVFTTGKIAGGRLLLVDSHFDEPIGLPPYEVVALPLQLVSQPARRR